MNQLTVMLNGHPTTSNQPHGHQQQQQQQFFTFQTSLPDQGAFQPIQTQGLSVDPNQSQPQSQQLVTFQTATPAMSHQTPIMLAANPGCAAASFVPGGGQQQAAIQYIITPSIQQASLPSHTQHPPMNISHAAVGQSHQQQAFGLMPNLIATPGSFNMIPINTATGASTTFLQPHLISATGATLQPSTAFINHQPSHSTTFQIQASNNMNSGAQLFHSPQAAQLQVIGNSHNANSAIINSNQLIGTPSGQQFILNQTLTPANNHQPLPPPPPPQQQQQQHQHPPQPQPIYQFVLPNGQIIHTLQPQPPATANLMSPSIISQSSAVAAAAAAANHLHQQPTAITVPIHNQSSPINSTALLASNHLAFSGQATTFLTTGQTAQSSPTAMIAQTTPMLPPVSQPITTQMFNASVTNQASGTGIRDNYLNLGPISNSSQSLVTTANNTLPSTSTISQTMVQNSNNVAHTSTATTAMMVLTQSPLCSLNTGDHSRSPLVPNMLLDQKSNSSKSTIINSKKDKFMDLNTSHSTGCQTAPLQNEKSEMLLTNNDKMQENCLTSAQVMAKVMPKVLRNTSEDTIIENNKIDRKDGILKNAPSSDCKNDLASHSPIQTTPNQSMDILKEISDVCDSKIPEKIESKQSVVEESTDLIESNRNQDAVLSRPASATSYGSLKIAEEESDDNNNNNNNWDGDENSNHNNHCKNDSNTGELNENDDRRIGIEMDVDETTATEIPDCGDFKETDFNEICSEKSMTITVKNRLQSVNKVGEKMSNNQDEKEGYQSSYGGSPCHFTDTEDEEEEEEEEEDNETGQIKLIRRNGLTQAAYNLINNRILSSEEDNATTTSIDSKCSSTSTSILNEELCTIDQKKINLNGDGKIPPATGNKVSIQIQTSATPSPSHSTNSSNSVVESESTSQNTLISSSFTEKTIWNAEEQQLVNDIQEFAKTFKLCRLSLGLTQAQVGQELSALGPCYSQSAICRFEKLDITLKSAKKIKPVLENWMREAEEKHRNNKIVGNINPETLVKGLMASKENVGASFKISSALELAHKSQKNDHNATMAQKCNETLSSSVNMFKVLMGASKKRKRRTSFTPAAIDALNNFFELNNHPTSAEMTKISQCLNYDRDVVRVWFCNKRQSTKAKSKTDTVNSSIGEAKDDSNAKVESAECQVSNGGSEEADQPNPSVGTKLRAPPTFSEFETSKSKITPNSLPCGQHLTPIPSHAQAVKTVVPTNVANGVPSLAKMAPISLSKNISKNDHQNAAESLISHIPSNMKSQTTD